MLCQTTLHQVPEDSNLEEKFNLPKIIQQDFTKNKTFLKYAESRGLGINIDKSTKRKEIRMEKVNSQRWLKDKIKGQNYS
jgi:hypothetical protein